jgi:hypothetical protein
MNKFIHQTAAAYLAIIILVRIMAMPLSLIDYTLNKNFISGNLCENRLKPKLQCAGKCYLNKQLTKANDSQESRDQKGTVKNIVIDFFETPDKPAFGCPEMASVCSGKFQTLRITGKFIASIFHPPII